MLTDNISNKGIKCRRFTETDEVLSMILKSIALQNTMFVTKLYQYNVVNHLYFSLCLI